MVTLHFDHTVFHSTARAASGFKLLAQRIQCRVIECQALDQGDAFAGSAFGFTRHTNDAVRRRPRFSRAALAGGHGLAASWAHAAGIGAVDQAAADEFGFHGNCEIEIWTTIVEQASTVARGLIQVLDATLLIAINTYFTEAMCENELKPKKGI
jgi:hypothetical protein